MQLPPRPSPGTPWGRVGEMGTLAVRAVGTVAVLVSGGHTDFCVTTSLQEAGLGVTLLSGQRTARRALGNTPYSLVSML